MKIAYAEKNSQKTYIVTCIGPCRQITAFLEVASGDADLYAREDRAPVIEVGWFSFVTIILITYVAVNIN